MTRRKNSDSFIPDVFGYNEKANSAVVCDQCCYNSDYLFMMRLCVCSALIDYCEPGLAPDWRNMNTRDR